MYIGNHLASSKGLEIMGKEAISLGANTFAFFTRNPRGGAAKTIDPKDAEKLRDLLKAHHFGTLVAHAPYTMNVCSEKEQIRNFSREMLADDLNRMEYLPGNYYNFHPGSHVGQGADAAIPMIADAVNSALKPEHSTTVLLETMAGKGSEVGRSFEELKQILDLILLKDKVEAIIVLPRDMFYTTDISVTLWIINMNKRAGTVNGRQVRNRENEVLFMDLRTWDNNVEEIIIDKGKRKKKTVLSDTQIAKVKEVYNNWQRVDRTLYSDVPEFCKSVKVKESDLTAEEKANGVVTIEKQNYALMPSKYVEFIDHDLDIDYHAEMQRIQKEMSDVIKQEKESQELLSAAFKGIGYGID